MFPSIVHVGRKAALDTAVEGPSGLLLRRLLVLAREVGIRHATLKIRSWADPNWKARRSEEGGDGARPSRVEPHAHTHFIFYISGPVLEAFATKKKSRK